MTDEELRDLVAMICRVGWRITVDDHRVITVESDEPPVDNRTGASLPSFGESFAVPRLWNRDRVIRRTFATLQFLTDHENREQFTVDGLRVFEAHEPSLTGEQHDWFVEAESAVRGY